MGSGVDFEQKGEDGLVNINQGGFLNRIGGYNAMTGQTTDSFQSGSSNGMSITQTGTLEGLQIEQEGSNNKVDLTQSGFINTTTISQSGSGNVVDAEQAGGFTTTSINQNANNSKISLKQSTLARGYETFLIQKGADNKLDLTQSSDGGKVDIEQLGTGDKILLVQN